MPFQIITPISHLFADPEVAKSITKASDGLEARENEHGDEATAYHSELNLLARWGANEEALLRKMNDRFSLSTVSFHLLNQYQETEIKPSPAGEAFVGKGTPMAAEEMIANAKENLELARSIFGDITFLAENINHLMTDAYDTVTDPAFISQVLGETGTGLLLDLAHARITATNTGTSYDSYLEALPLHRCVQVHLSKQSIVAGIGRDTHDAPGHEELEELRSLQTRLPNLQYVTIEYYKDSEQLLSILNDLKEVQRAWS